MSRCTRVHTQDSNEQQLIVAVTCSRVCNSIFRSYRARFEGDLVLYCSDPIEDRTCSDRELA